MKYNVGPNSDICLAMDSSVFEQVTALIRDVFWKYFKNNFMSS